MMITDCWIDEQYNKTAVYCDNVDGTDFAGITKAQINHKKYNIIGFDVLTSIAGAKNAMLLLDTTEQVSVPQEIVVS